MVRFDFKLQKVLDARTSFEDRARREFGEAVQEHERQLAVGRELNHQRHQLLEDMATRRKKTLPAEDYVQDIQFEWSLRMKIKGQDAVIKTAQDKLEKKREKLIQAMKDRKIMEKLRDRKFEEFRKLRNKEEFKFSDEIAGRKAHFEQPPFNGE